MAKSTYQEAVLMLQLAQWGATVGAFDAGSWVMSDEYIPNYTEFVKKFPRGSEGYRNASKVCNYYESLGTLWKHGLIGEDLLFDWIAVRMVWERISGFALGVRQERGNPRLYENFEAMARASVTYDARLTKRAAKANKRNSV